MMEIKLLKKGIKVGGYYYPCWYSSAKNNKDGCATIYLRTYEPLPAGFSGEGMEIENGSDLLTDYFEKDKIRIGPGSKYFSAVELLAATK
jgi:hypothetical protein